MVPGQPPPTRAAHRDLEASWPQSRAGVPPALAGILRPARRLPYSPPATLPAMCRSALEQGLFDDTGGLARRDGPAAPERAGADATRHQQRQREPDAQERGEVIHSGRTPFLWKRSSRFRFSAFCLLPSALNWRRCAGINGSPQPEPTGVYLALDFWRLALGGGSWCCCWRILFHSILLRSRWRHATQLYYGEAGWNSSCPPRRSAPNKGACVKSDRSALGRVLVVRDKPAGADVGGPRVRSALRDLVQPNTQSAQVFGLGAGPLANQVEPTEDGGL